MKIVNKVSVIALVVAFILGFFGSSPVFAATTPPLGSTSTYSVVSNTFTNSNTALQTIINGDVCYTTAPATPPMTITGATTVPCPPLVGLDQDSSLANLNSQVCTDLGPGAVDLDAITIGANPPGTFPPGCYESGGAMNVTLGTTVTLNGAGIYIFRSGGALTTGDNSLVTLANGASACDVFWTPGAAATLGANATSSSTPTFVGNIIDPDGITLGHFANLLGRTLAFSETVTTDANTITIPTCAAAASINVVKTVVNDNSGTKTIADFPLFVNGTPVTSGDTNVFPAPASYIVTETADSDYVQTFSGDCDLNGNITLAPGDNMFCIITNDDIPPPSSGGGGGSRRIAPPLIEVIKIPNPLSLPGGPGSVTYTYTLRNIGTEAVTDITMVGDTCSPVTLISGDADTDERLDVNEIWTYNCTTTLSITHTNTVTATGWANGISAVDVASATVVVGGPGFPDTGDAEEIVPPLIHVTKVPSTFSLSVGGGMVTYTNIVTNPGTIPLSDVSLVDDTCSPVAYVSGDTNSDSMLDTSEAWVYICQTNLTKTTTNTVIAEGFANGLSMRDFAIATVVVPIPGLPNTGFSDGKNIALNILVPGVIFIALFSFYLARKKKII